MHVHSNDPACFPRQRPDSPRAEPGHRCSCTVVQLGPSLAPEQPVVPRVKEDPSPARTRNAATRAGNEKLARVGAAFLGTDDRGSGNLTEGDLGGAGDQGVVAFGVFGVAA